MADDLMPCALAAFEHLRTHGYKVRCEVPNYAAPFTPTITAQRESTVLHVEVVGSVDIDRLSEWVSYGRSASRDTRLTVCVLVTQNVSAATIAQLRGLGLGLYTVANGHVVEGVQAIDLAMNVQLPPLEKLPARARQLLGHSYEQFGRGEWREAFEGACNALEEEARRYLTRWSNTGRIRVSSHRSSRQLAAAEIKRMTIGRLASSFGSILAPNSLDVAIEQALTAINPDRVERTHRRRQKRTEERLRKNVGQHMWLIANILKQICSK